MLVEKFIIGKCSVRKRSLVLELIAGITIFSMIVPIVLVHVCLWMYQQIYFSIFDIPKTRLNEFMSLDRARLRKLSPIQKIGCAYCGYANGVAAWMKAITNRTELYSCAIKHKTDIKGHEYQRDFFDFDHFA